MNFRSLVLGSALTFSLLAAAACAPGPQVTVLRGTVGETQQVVSGDGVKFVRPDQLKYTGATPGYYVIRNEEDFAKLWKESPNGTPPLPADLGFTRGMIIVATGESPDIGRIQIRRIVDTATVLHVYADETLLGEKCPKNGDMIRAHDVVTTERLDKPVRFHVDVANGDSCGAGPQPHVNCRVEKSTSSNSKLEVPIGSKIECEAKTETTGKASLMDHDWRFTSIPAGSATKLTFHGDRDSVSFPADTFGRYIVRFDIHDDSGRRGSAVGEIDVPPPKTSDPFVQLAWSGFEASDDPSTFPRVALKASHDGKECAVDASPKPAWCEMKGEGFQTHLRVKGMRAKLPVAVEYLDARVDGGPFLCLRVYVMGKRTTEVCDRTARGASAKWEPGILNPQSGMFEEKPAEVPDAGAPPAASAAPAKAAPPKKADAKK